MATVRRYSLVLLLAVAVLAAGVYAAVAGRAEAQPTPAVAASPAVASPASRAAAELAPAGPGGAAPRFTMAPVAIGDKKAGVFIIDSQTMRLLVYAIDADTKQLKLLVVRDISQDVRMSHWNNEKPWPEDIRELIEPGPKAEANSPEPPR